METPFIARRWAEGQTMFAPCGVAYGASHAARGLGRIRALLAPYPPSLRSVRYRSHPSMDMRERERFASQGAKRRGRNPQRCYDPSDDRDGTAGVPSTQPVLVREPTSAFSVRWGGSYCPLCSTPRNRGRSAPRKAPSYLSPNQGIDPLT